MATTREVYLISISVQNSRDHWGLYFPSTDSETRGKILHVVGAPVFGFKHEVKHHWDMTKSRANCSIHLLGETDAANIVDAENTAGTSPTLNITHTLSKDDKFENRASHLEAPGIAPANLWPTGTVTQMMAGWAKDIDGVRRCQEWTTNLIDDLVKQRLLPETALAVLEAVKAARYIPAD